jgi:hypothetical protein
MSNLALNAIDLVVLCGGGIPEGSMGGGIQEIRQESSLISSATGRGECRSPSKEGIVIWVACYTME